MLEQSKNIFGEINEVRLLEILETFESKYVEDYKILMEQENKFKVMLLNATLSNNTNKINIEEPEYL